MSDIVQWTRRGSQRLSLVFQLREGSNISTCGGGWVADSRKARAPYTYLKYSNEEK